MALLRARHAFFFHTGVTIDPQTESKTSLPKASTLGECADMLSSPLCLCGEHLSAHLTGWLEWSTNPTTI